MNARLYIAPVTFANSSTFGWVGTDGQVVPSFQLAMERAGRLIAEELYSVAGRAFTSIDVLPLIERQEAPADTLQAHQILDAAAPDEAGAMRLYFTIGLTGKRWARFEPSNWSSVLVVTARSINHLNRPAGTPIDDERAGIFWTWHEVLHGLSLPHWNDDPYDLDAIAWTATAYSPHNFQTRSYRGVGLHLQEVEQIRQHPGLVEVGDVVSGPQLVKNPFDELAWITSSSNQGHHTPYGGDVSLDLDVATVSQGQPVTVRRDPPVSGEVASVRPACASGVIADGGWYVEIEFDDGKRLGYAHLDPVHVAQGERVQQGDEIGRLGPPPPSGEYRSACAFASHLHLEGFGFAEVVDRNEQIDEGEALMAGADGGADGGAGTFSPVPKPGLTLVTYSGGDLAGFALACASEGISTAIVTSGGKFIVYVVGAPPFVNVEFTRLFASGIPDAQPMLVVR